MTWNDISAAGAAPAGEEPVDHALELPSDVEAPEPPVFFLDGGTAGPAAPMVSPILAALYESQGDPARASAIRQTLARGSAESHLAARLQGWLEGLRDVRAAWLVCADGSVAAETHGEGGPGRPAAGWQLMLEEVRGLAEVLGWGRPLTLGLVRASGKTAWGFLASDMTLGIEGGPDALPGQLRGRLHAVLAEAGAPSGTAAARRVGG
jgi:hypothetical protein